MPASDSFKTRESEKPKLLPGGRSCKTGWHCFDTVCFIEVGLQSSSATAQYIDEVGYKILERF